MHAQKCQSTELRNHSNFGVLAQHHVSSLQLPSQSNQHYNHSKQHRSKQDFGCHTSRLSDFSIDVLYTHMHILSGLSFITRIENGLLFWPITIYKEQLQLMLLSLKANRYARIVIQGAITQLLGCKKTLQCSSGQLFKILRPFTYNLCKMEAAKSAELPNEQNDF